MAIYTIGDLHLSTNQTTNKSMEKFGKRWLGYTDKLLKNWKAVVTPSDTVVIPGDISWAMKLEEALSDFLFLDSLPGTKLLSPVLKGIIPPKMWKKIIEPQKISLFLRGEQTQQKT